MGGLFQPTGRKAAGSVSGGGSPAIPTQVPGPSHTYFDSHTHGRNKLRKPRSIPDLASAHASANTQDATGAVNVGTGASASTSGQGASTAKRSGHATGRTHSHSVTGADMSRLRGLPSSAFGNTSTVSTSHDSPFALSTGNVSKPTGDVFCRMMGWTKGESISTLGSPKVVRTGISAHDSEVPCCARHGKPDIRHPFGRGVVSFDSPARAPFMWTSLSANLAGIDVNAIEDNDGDGDTVNFSQLAWGKRFGGRELREVQSFESGLTARAVSVRRIKRVESRESGSASGSGEGTDLGAGHKSSEKNKSAMLRHDSIDSLSSAVVPSLSTHSQDEKADDNTLTVPTSPSAIATPTATSTATFSPHSPVSNRRHVSSRVVPSLQSSLHTRYATSVFDVIQNYRGLPMLDLLDDSQASIVRQPTIKMSLSALDGAVPRDDPRFVIWGEIRVGVDDGDDEGEGKSRELVGSAVGSEKDVSVSSRRSSRVINSNVSWSRRNSHGKASGVPPPPELRIEGISDNDSGVGGFADDPISPSVSSFSMSQDSDGRAGSTLRVMMAATIERWIAQLTSQLDYDELLIFFLTYRAYINALDLGHLLICRFHWALEEPVGNTTQGVVGGDAAHEIMVKQIVRVRTFVAIRYWLLTFFRIDFLPNRELCLLFANWLNTLWTDPILDRYRDAKVSLRNVILITTGADLLGFFRT